MISIAKVTKYFCFAWAVFNLILMIAYITDDMLLLGALHLVFCLFSLLCFYSFHRQDRKTPPERYLSLIMNEECRDRLDHVKQINKIKSDRNLVVAALAAFDFLSEETSKGSTIIIRDMFGNEREISLKIPEEVTND